MKRTFRILHCGASKMHFGTLFVSCFLAAGPLSSGAPLKSAHVSQVIRDVRLLPTNAAPRPAAVNDNIVEGTAVRTGIESRAELTFADLTITRLGENTVFSFREAARELNISKGAVLLEVPSKAPAARINTAAVTAAVMGGTGLFATGPPVKFMVLEGVGTFYPAGHPERAVTVHAGEMVMMTADGHITQPTKFNVQLILQTSHLIVDFPALANLPLILQVVNQQLAEQAAGTSNPPPSKNSLDIIDVLNQNATANPAVENFTAPPAPPGLPVITSSGPYVINNGTVIATHPTITTNGVTNVGVLYRGRKVDGPVSAFAFGSTSPFDIVSGFDFQIGGNNAAAGFKFTSLQLAGNPTIITRNGPIDLGLIALNGITSGAPGGMVTFAGLKGVLLAAQKGSINLGSEISFSGLHDLNIYARGSGSDLTLGSDISTTSKVRLFAERDMFTTSNITTDDLFAVSGRDMQIGGSATTPIQAVTITLNAFHNFTWTGETSDQTASNSTGDVTITAGQTLTILNDLNIVRHNGGISSGLNINLTAGGDLIAGNLTGGSQGLGVTVDNSVSRNLDTGADITVNAGGNLTVNGTGALSLLVANNDGGHIGTGGNISVTTGGNLSANSVNAFINNRNGGSIGSGANLNFNIAGALTTKSDALTGDIPGESLSLLISNRNDGSGGGTIGSDVALNLKAASVSVGGNMLATISTNFGGNIVSGSVNISIAGDFTIQGNAADANSFGLVEGAIIDIENTANVTTGGVAVPGGTIGSNAIVNLSAKNVFGSLQLDILNGGFKSAVGGTIGGDATINANAANILSATPNGGFDAFIQNRSGGKIGGNATINVSAASISSTATGGFVGAEIFNGNGGGANGGTIGGDATINLTAANISTGGALDAFIVNTGGSIGGSAAINMNVSGTAKVTTDATFEILGSNGVAKGAAINFNGGSYGVGGTFLSTIDGDGTITFNKASLHADVVKVGVFGNNGTLTIGGGPISANTLLKLYAPGSNGTLNFTANLILSSGTVADLAANTITIQPSVVVTIAGNGGPANIFTNHPNYNFTPGPGYAGPPGNPSNGSFGGNGARDPKPLANAPPFNASTASSSASIVGGGTQTSSSTNVTSSSSKVNGGLGGVPIRKGGEPAMPNRKTTGGTINVGSSAELLSLLDAAVPSLGGKITIPTPNRIHRAQNSNRSNVDARFKANGGRAEARHVRDSADNPRLLASARSF